MNIRIENRNGFSIKGYLIETLATDESYDAKSIALRERHEAATCFELFGDDGLREIWVPVEKAIV